MDSVAVGLNWRIPTVAVGWNWVDSYSRCWQFGSFLVNFGLVNLNFDQLQSFLLKITDSLPNFPFKLNRKCMLKIWFYTSAGCGCGDKFWVSTAIHYLLSSGRTTKLPLPFYSFTSWDSWSLPVRPLSPQNRWPQLQTPAEKDKEWIKSNLIKSKTGDNSSSGESQFRRKKWFDLTVICLFCLSVYLLWLQQCRVE